MSENIGLDITAPVDRLRAYKKMLRSYKWSLYTPNFFHNTQYGMCFWLRKNFSGGSPFAQLYNYPEFNSKDNLFRSGYWWETGDIKPRILAIQKAISDVEKII